MGVQQIHGHVRQARHNGVKDVEDRRDEDESELHRLGDPSQEAGECRREQNTGRDFFIFGMRFMIYRQTRRRQGKQHQREFTLHELTGVLVGVAAEGFHPFFQHLEPDGLVAVDHLARLSGVITK